MKRKCTGQSIAVRYPKQMSPVIFTCLSAAGMVTTVVFAVKATPKAVRLIEEKKKTEERELTKCEIVNATWKCYIPTFLMGASTLACMFGTAALGKKQQTAYLGAYSLLDTTFKQYRGKVSELYGEETDTGIQAAVINERPKNFVSVCDDLTIYPQFSDDEEYPTEGKVVFYEQHRDEFFETTMAEVVLAESHLNRNFNLRGTVTLNEFYGFLGLPLTNIGDALGWSQADGYCWIDFMHYKRKLDDGMEYYIISPQFAPTADFEAY